MAVAMTATVACATAEPAYTQAEDNIMIFSQDGPKAAPDPWRARLDLISALADSK